MSDGKLEPDWGKLWNDKVGNVTYAGVIVVGCRICGEHDRDYCDCAKTAWIKRRKEKYAKDSNYLCRQDRRRYETVLNARQFDYCQGCKVEIEKDFTACASGKCLTCEDCTCPHCNCCKAEHCRCKGCSCHGTPDGSDEDEEEASSGGQ